MENTNNYSPVYQQSEIIQKIENLGGKYDSTSALPIDDQLFICELLIQENFGSTIQEKNNDNANGNVSVNGSVNDTYKRSVNSALSESKQNVIAELKTFSYRTPPIKIAQALQILFSDSNSRDGWWLSVAQRWNPRAINRVINKMIKVHRSGTITIQNPAAYFTHLIKLRKKRKSL